jgi:hypothetical protein
MYKNFTYFGETLIHFHADFLRCQVRQSLGECGNISLQFLVSLCPFCHFIVLSYHFVLLEKLLNVKCMLLHESVHVSAVFSLWLKVFYFQSHFVLIEACFRNKTALFYVRNMQLLSG